MNTWRHFSILKALVVVALWVEIGICASRPNVLFIMSDDQGIHLFFP